MEDQILFGERANQSILIEISANGLVHVTHDVGSGSSSRFVEFIRGSVDNVKVHDKNGGDVMFGEAGYGDIGGVTILSTVPVEVEYDLGDVLELVNGMWHWDYLYSYGNAKFYLPDGVNFVYVNDRYVELGNAKGLNCHGCGIALGYYIDAKPVIKNVEWESEKIPVEIFSPHKTINFNFIQPDKIITVETENPQIITFKIPLELLWNPYQVYFIENVDKSSLISPQNVTECNEKQDKITIQGTAKCYDKIFNNEIEIDEDNVLLTIHPKKAGTIIILGTSAIPEFPLFMPLAIGILLVILFQFRNKISFDSTSIP